MKKLIKIFSRHHSLISGYRVRGFIYFGTNIASDKIVEELENSGQLVEAKQYVEITRS